MKFWPVVIFFAFVFNVQAQLSDFKNINFEYLLIIEFVSINMSLKKSIFFDSEG